MRRVIEERGEAGKGGTGIKKEGGRKTCILFED